MMSNSNQLINDDFKSDFFTTSDALSSTLDTISSSDQSMVMREIELQKAKTECAQSIVEDNRINFQLLSGEYGLYFKNFTEILLFTKHMITTKAYEGFNGELWLSEITYLIDLFNVIEPVKVWLKDIPELPNYQFYVIEILYSHRGQWKIRDCKLRHLHPIEYTQISASAPYNVPTFKIMLDIYYNNFSTFHNVYYSLGGIYLQFCNKPLRLRQKLKNHIVLDFVPFGEEFDDVIKPIINKIKILEKGTLFNIAGQDIWVIAALGVITANLSQSNDLANTKHHNANQGCRSCWHLRSNCVILLLTLS
ncbi:hypothetical protein F8M41_026234 [Gigaspora margarita]|uniref:Uncharacterized protein n=1 Tax=Gigaspora margarita TaxID=4874 RepID=A0A8H3XH61_GIGMA|nr:hypothetical protein F8M41_026234 [Gigaspora margarita]